MIRKILVALDGSSVAPAVLDAATEIAERFDAELMLLRVVVVPPDFPAAAHVATPDPLPRILTDEAARELATLAAGNARAAAAPTLVEVGEAWRAIVAAAEKHDVDLVVIGSHGYGGWDRLLGTTAARVANRASRSVLVVHPREPRG